MTYYIKFPRSRRTRRTFQNHQTENHEVGFRLPVNIQEEDEGFSLNAVVPGLTADDIDIQIIEDTITIEGEYKSDESTFLMREIPDGKFHRSLRMPTELDANKAEAEIKNGILTVRVPKLNT
jgi:HSP20 family protein